MLTPRVELEDLSAEHLLDAEPLSFSFAAPAQLAVIASRILDIVLAVTSSVTVADLPAAGRAVYGRQLQVPQVAGARARIRRNFRGRSRRASARVRSGRRGH